MKVNAFIKCNLKYFYKKDETSQCEQLGYIAEEMGDIDKRLTIFTEDAFKDV
jgi:hypothetical protein